MQCIHHAGSFINLSSFIVKGHGVTDTTYKEMDCDFHFQGAASTKITEAQPFSPVLFHPCMKSDTAEVMSTLFAKQKLHNGLVVLRNTPDVHSQPYAQDVYMCDSAGAWDPFYVEGVVFLSGDVYIGKTGDPRGMGSNHTYMLYDCTDTSIKVKSILYMHTYVVSGNARTATDVINMCMIE